MRTTRRRGALVVAAVAAASLLAAPAHAATGSVTIADDLSTPSALAVGEDGEVLAAQLVPGAVHEVSTGTLVDVLTSARAVTGVAFDEDGGIVATRVSGAVGSDLVSVRPGGRASEVADLATYEAAANPDQGNTYGFADLDVECAAAVPATSALPGGGLPYRGDVDSRAAAVAALPDGSFVVADERGNSVVRVAPGGQVSTVAVLPPVTVRVTADVAAARGLPGCTIGSLLALEPGPTDVELGPDGLLYVTSMPAAPGSGSALPDGSVFTVDPGSGAVERVGGGFRGPKDLAVAPDGTVYVAELFGGQISVLRSGAPATFRLVPRPSAVEYDGDALYAAVGFSFGPPDAGVVAYFLR